jgi:hypothetical protein
VREELNTMIVKKLTLMLNFFFIWVRKKPKYVPNEIVKATARYKKKCRLVTIKATQLRSALTARMK